MDMNKSFVLRKEDRKPEWHVIDVSDKILGRVCTRIADLLHGTHKVDFTPHTDNGDYVVVINCKKVKLSGKKWKDKMYSRYSGYRGGLKERSAEEVFKKDPAQLFYLAIKGMLPKNRQSRQMIKRLKVYAGSEHPHSQVLANSR